MANNDPSYDDDAKVLETASDVQTDSDSDGDTLVYSPTQRDKDVLEDHEEAERLLSDAGASQEKPRWASKNAKRHASGSTRKKRSRVDDRFVYKMEEGVKDSSSASSSTDSLVRQTDSIRKASSGYGCVWWIVLATSITALSCLLTYGAYHASSFSKPRKAVTRTYSNGTNIFQATTILISLDGFRADFLHRGLTPSMSAFVASGVSPQYMLPSFPSVTFPNHYTLVTGLFPESHGIVSNQFWDPEFEEVFYYTNTAISMQSRWWEAAEPIWVTAQKQGLKTAVHMWPGSEAHIHGIDPTYLDKYAAFEKLPKKADRILELLDKDDEHRPQLIAAYVPDVDRDGHAYGPNSTQISATIADADNMLTLLIEGLLHRNLTELVNLVIVSDHGMATLSPSRMVQLDDLIDLDLVDHIDGWPLRGLRLKDPNKDLEPMYQQLSRAANQHGSFDVYTIDTMPERYHFSNNPRIAPLWIVPKTGWLVIDRKEFDIASALKTGQPANPIGAHGFDHEHPLMRAIFIARGPAFPHAPNSRIPVFQNIEVYNIVCDSIGIEPHANNGTIRLPMRIEGLHSDYTDTIPIPSDDPADIRPSGTSLSTLPSGTTATLPIDTFSSTTTENPVSAPSTPSLGSTSSSPTIVSPSGAPTPGSEDSPQVKQSWWDYLHNSLQKAKDWAAQVINSIKGNMAQNENQGSGSDQDSR